MAWPAWAPEIRFPCTGRDRGHDLRRVRLHGLLLEERVIDLRALDPTKAEQRQRLRRDAEDVLEQDDAGRLVRHARVDLRGCTLSSPPSLYAVSEARARRGGVGRLQVRMLTHPDVGRPRPARIAPVAFSAARRVLYPLGASRGDHDRCVCA